MGKNKLQKFADIATYHHVFEAPLAKTEEFKLKGEWNSGFFKNNNPIIVELGCGKGEYSVKLGEMYPDKNFIGIDIKGARIWSGAKQSLEKGMKNVAFLRTNIEMLESFFAENEIAEIWITFPDPQMKKYRKRLTASNFLAMYNRLLREDGLVHLKTDSNFLYTYTTAIIAENKLNTIVNTNDLYNSGIVDSILEIQTHYEQQWLERGLTIKYIKFNLDKGATFTEPDIEIEPDPYRSYNRSRRSNQDKKED